MTHWHVQGFLQLVLTWLWLVIVTRLCVMFNLKSVLSFICELHPLTYRKTTVLFCNRKIQYVNRDLEILNPLLHVFSTDSNNLNNASRVICSQTPGKVLYCSMQLNWSILSKQGSHLQKVAGRKDILHIHKNYSETCWEQITFFSIVRVTLWRWNLRATTPGCEVPWTGRAP